MRTVERSTTACEARAAESMDGSKMAGSSRALVAVRFSIWLVSKRRWGALGDRVLGDRGAVLRGAPANPPALRTRAEITVLSILTRCYGCETNNAQGTQGVFDY